MTTSEENCLGLVSRALALYVENPEFDEEAVAAVLVEEGVDSTLALLAACLLPAGFGCVFVVDGLGVAPVDRFVVKDSRGEWVAYTFNEQPIARAVMKVAIATYVHGPRSTFKALALRSAEVATANQAISAGANLVGASLSPPQLFGLLAEDLGSEGRCA